MCEVKNWDKTKCQSGSLQPTESELEYLQINHVQDIQRESLHKNVFNRNSMELEELTNNRNLAGW